MPGLISRGGGHLRVAVNWQGTCYHERSQNGGGGSKGGSAMETTERNCTPNGCRKVSDRMLEWSDCDITKPFEKAVQRVVRDTN